MVNTEMVSSAGFRHHSQVWTTIGMWAWLLHRLTGIGLVSYIFLHIALMSSSLLRGQEAFNTMLSVLMGHPLFELLDTLLLGAVLYHSFNGIRILLFDLGIGIDISTQKITFWVFMAVAAIVWVWSIIIKF